MTLQHVHINFVSHGMHTQNINDIGICMVSCFFYMMSKSIHQKIMCINEIMHASNVQCQCATRVVLEVL